MKQNYQKNKLILVMIYLNILIFIINQMKLNTMRLILFFLNSYLNIYKLTIILLNHHIYYQINKKIMNKIIINANVDHIDYKIH